MEITAIKTRALQPPQDDFFSVLEESLPPLKESDILLITSKVLSIHQGRTIKIEEGIKKDDLIYKEADQYIPRDEVPCRYSVLTIKEHTLISSAGIDESNANGYYILWPDNVVKLLGAIRDKLKKKFGLNKLGVIAVDSHSLPLRYGTVGISIGFVGLEPLRSYVDTPDIFGRPFNVSKSNTVDALAAASVYEMGEGREQTPMAIARNVSGINFTDENKYEDLLIPPEDDMYAPLLKRFRFKNNVKFQNSNIKKAEKNKNGENN